MSARSEAKLKARSVGSRQISTILNVDAKLRFALLASLRSAILSEINLSLSPEELDKIL